MRAPRQQRWATFAQDGTNYFALSLKPGAVVPVADQHDIVVLVNTSAAQVGSHRVEAMEALKGLLAKLGPQDRVQLMAVDLSAVSLTSAPVAAGSPEMAAAIAKLDQREPLGATDLEKGIRAAIAALAKASGAKALVYIGDGSSKANLITAEKFEQLTGDLVSARIPVLSYGAGAVIDEQLLAALAVQTGGRVFTAEAGKDEAESRRLIAESAKALAEAVRSPVLWPTKTVWPAQFGEVFPKRTPPLRTDRESVVIGTAKTVGPLDVQMTVETSAGTKQLSWKVGEAPRRRTTAT